MNRIDVVFFEGRWVGEADGDIYAEGATREEALEATLQFVEVNPLPFTVNIHDRDGNLEEERVITE